MIQAFHHRDLPDVSACLARRNDNPLPTIWPPLDTSGTRYYRHAQPDVRPRGPDAAARSTTIGSTPSSDSRRDPQLSSVQQSASSSPTDGTYNNRQHRRRHTGVVRLRRVWDTWSTEYSRGAGHRRQHRQRLPARSAVHPPPIYPSYPPPYPAPLRGIQIQIRVADPTNQRIKSLTIRQDFTDKLVILSVVSGPLAVGSMTGWLVAWSRRQRNGEG